jgi:hypothetical protein
LDVVSALDLSAIYTSYQSSTGFADPRGMKREQLLI